FSIDRRKRAERISLTLEDEPVSGLVVHLAGLDAFLASNADLVDAIAEPEAYRGATTGNEILVVGGPMSGKRTLAAWIAKAARMDRLITVHSALDPVVLSAAKRLLAHYARQKVLLLLPNLDRVFEAEDQELLSELDALIDHATEQPNVLVI